MRVEQKDFVEIVPLKKDSKYVASATSCSFSAYLGRESAPSAELIAHRVGTLAHMAGLQDWERGE